MGNSVNGSTEKTTSTALSPKLTAEKEQELPCIYCPSIYHCCLEWRLLSHSKWTTVWPFLEARQNKKTLKLYQDKYSNIVDMIEITDYYDVHEYFVSDVPSKDLVDGLNIDIFDTDWNSWQFILNGKHIFRCKNYNQRDVFIRAISETLHYTKGCNMIHKWQQFEYKYTPIFYHLSNKIQMKKTDIHCTNNDKIFEWFDIPMKFATNRMQFALSIKKNARFAIKSSDLKHIVDAVITKYFANNYKRIRWSFQR